MSDKEKRFPTEKEVFVRLTVFLLVRGNDKNRIRTVSYNPNKNTEWNNLKFESWLCVVKILVGIKF